MSIGVGKFNTATDPRRAAIEKAKIATSGVKPEDAKLVKYIPASECKDRIRLVFDDSSSMSSHIQYAKDGVVEFLRNCVPNQTAVAVHYMNTIAWSTELRSDLPQLASDVLNSMLSSGSTPFFNTLKRALEATPRLTRLVAFTDGSPTDALNPEGTEELQNIWGSHDRWMNSADVIIKISKATEPAISIDTVYFGEGESYESARMNLLKYLSTQTGGFFLHFKPSQPNIWKQLKYLAPVNRLRLTDGAFRAAVERGEG